MPELLFYTPKDQRDYLGHTIARITHGTWSHVAITEGSRVVEAVPPAIRLLVGKRATDAIAGASGRYTVKSEDWLPAWTWLEAQLGHGYSFGTILSDLLANTFGLRSVLKLPGTSVCSALGAKFLFLAHDPIIREFEFRSPDELTPADLGEICLQKRVPRPKS